MARFSGRIETREQMESCLKADCSNQSCDTYLVTEERERFLRMYDAYCAAAEAHIGSFYDLAGSQRLNGWVDNGIASANAVIQTPFSWLAGAWYGSSGGLGEAYRQMGATAAAARHREMQKGCEYTAEAISQALARCDRPRGWHTMICRIGRGVNHVAAAACHAPPRRVKRPQGVRLESLQDTADLVPHLQANGYVFDPWLRGRPDVYTVPGWQDTVSLFFVQLHWQNGQMLVEAHTSPQREAELP